MFSSRMCLDPLFVYPTTLMAHPLNLSVFQLWILDCFVIRNKAFSRILTTLIGLSVPPLLLHSRYFHLLREIFFFSWCYTWATSTWRYTGSQIKRFALRRNDWALCGTSSDWPAPEQPAYEQPLISHSVWYGSKRRRPTWFIFDATSCALAEAAAMRVPLFAHSLHILCTSGWLKSYIR